MIKSLTVTNCYNQSAKITLANENPLTHGFLVKSIDGLGPAKANINATQLATFDGSFYNSARLDPRNIVIKLIFTESQDGGDIERARLKSYRYFPIKRYVDLKIETDQRTAITRGYVESNEPDIFSSMEETSISIICPDPYFYDSEETVEHFNIGEAAGANTDVTINNFGDLAIGFVTELSATSASIDGPGVIRIRNMTTGRSMYIDTSYIYSLSDRRWQTDDTIILSTIKADKYLRLHFNNDPSDIYSNILNSLGYNPKWMTLKKGNNHLRFTMENAFNMACTFKYRVAYEGV